MSKLSMRQMKQLNKVPNHRFKKRSVIQKVTPILGHFRDPVVGEGGGGSEGGVWSDFLTKFWFFWQILIIFSFFSIFFTFLIKFWFFWQNLIFFEKMWFLVKIVIFWPLFQIGTKKRGGTRLFCISRRFWPKIFSAETFGNAKFWPKMGGKKGGFGGVKSGGGYFRLPHLHFWPQKVSFFALKTWFLTPKSTKIAKLSIFGSKRQKFKILSKIDKIDQNDQKLTKIDKNWQNYKISCEKLMLHCKWIFPDLCKIIKNYQNLGLKWWKLLKLW